MIFMRLHVNIFSESSTLALLSMGATAFHLTWQEDLSLEKILHYCLLSICECFQYLLHCIHTTLMRNIVCTILLHPNLATFFYQQPR